MNEIMALDIETGNYSWEIGGFGNKTLFDPTVIATWDGEEATIFSKEEVKLEGTTHHDMHPRIIGEHILNHVEKGGKLLGHNIINFDLPVIRDSLDCWSANDVLQKHSENLIDTKVLVHKASLSLGKIATSLDQLSKHTLNSGKSMKSVEAPEAWRAGKFKEVTEYCLKDAKLTYDLYMFGKENGMIKSRSLDSGEIIEVEVEW